MSSGASTRPLRSRRPALFTRVKTAITRDDIPPGSWIQNAGGAAVLGIKTLGQLVTPGLSWRQAFIRQFVFAFKATQIPATNV